MFKNRLYAQHCPFSAKKTPKKVINTCYSCEIDNKQRGFHVDDYETKQFPTHAKQYRAKGICNINETNHLKTAGEASRKVVQWSFSEVQSKHISKRTH